MWNLWHGCHKKSEGCANCYVYRGDAKRDRDASLVFKTKQFYKPIEKNRKGEYKVKSGEYIFTCFSSDFLLENCDAWRTEAWDMIRERSDCTFIFITKRIERFMLCATSDIGTGYDNLVVGCTCENQSRADERLPIFLNCPIKHRFIVCEPLLTKINLDKYLSENIEEVVAGGESGAEARLCNYEWIEELRKTCINKNVSFTFKQTGYRFKKDERLYLVTRTLQHSQARKANINFVGKVPTYMGR